MKRLLMSAALASTLLATTPQVLAQQKLDLKQSEIVFVSKQMGVPVDGKFKKFDAQMNFDPKNPQTSKVSFTVDLASADIGNAETERELTKPGWFDTSKFPQATFASSAIKSLGGGKFEVTGKLAIKGNARDVVVPVAVTQAGGLSTARGEFVLKRLDFKIGDGEWNDPSLVANDVTVKFKIAVTGMAPLYPFIPSPLVGEGMKGGRGETCESCAHRLLTDVTLSRPPATLSPQGRGERNVAWATCC
ncbi:MAG: YceI family protein, partial [Casimicrobium sp.]